MANTSKPCRFVYSYLIIRKAADRSCKTPSEYMTDKLNLIRCWMVFIGGLVNRIVVKKGQYMTLRNIFIYLLLHTQSEKTSHFYDYFGKTTLVIFFYENIMLKKTRQQFRIIVVIKGYNVFIKMAIQYYCH
jgi:hypothetical protein